MRTSMAFAIAAFSLMATSGFAETLDQCARSASRETLTIVTQTVGLSVPSQLDGVVGAIGIKCLRKAPGEIDLETKNKFEDDVYPVAAKIFGKNHPVLVEWAHYHRLSVAAPVGRHGSAAR